MDAARSVFLPCPQYRSELLVHVRRHLGEPWAAAD